MGKRLERRDDEVHLQWLWLRERGQTSTQLGDMFGVASSHVRSATNRICADYAESTGGQDTISFPQVP